MAKNDTVKRLGNDVCENYLGFLPTSNSTKPPHIANGLFRACSGEICDTRDVHEWIVSERRRGAISSEDIVEKYHNILWEGNKEKAENVKQVRFLLEEIFNPDSTVYPNYDFSVMNISSHWLVKGRVNSEANIGDFLFDILSKTIDGKRSPAIDLIKKSLENDSDDLTKLIKPIIVFPSENEKRNLIGITYSNESDIRWDSCKLAIRKGFDNLANNMKKTGEYKNSLLVHERMINFASFATFLYLVNANSAIYNGKMVPILIDSGSDMESIKKASEQCYSAAKTAVEDYYISSIDAILEKEVSGKSKNACLRWMNEMVFNTTAREDEIRPAISNYFESFCADGYEPTKALAHALQIILYTFDYKNNSPSDFCRVLGVRGGFIGPRGNRAKSKRYLFNSFTLETITYSILSIDEIEDGIELKELSRKATLAYNLLLGADVETEYKILEQSNIVQGTPGDLRGDMSINAQRIADTYISFGLGHRYADGVTIIGRRL